MDTPSPAADRTDNASGPKKATGNRGEDLAAEFLQQHHHHIQCRQWRHGHLEIDIIASDLVTGEIVFVEVKTRHSEDYGDPIHAVDSRKIRRLCAAANFYLTSGNIAADYRFDIITVLLPHGAAPVITHYRDAFYPPLQR